MAIQRSEIMRQLRAQLGADKPIVACGAGTEISTKFAGAGGADQTTIHNSGHCRMSGRGSLTSPLPFGDANSTVVEMAAESRA